jgi:UDP-glucose:(heptosyl)LPS alpha-1,3-glucosyltransferase
MRTIGMTAQALRIGMVAQDFHREGGSEGRTGQLVDRLVAEGHEVHLVGARIRGRWDPRVVLHPIRVVRHPHWAEVLLFARRAAAIVGGQAFDIVHNQIRPFVPGVVTVGGGCHQFYLREVMPLEKGALCAATRRRLPLHRVLLAMERRGFRPDRCPCVIANSALGRAGILAYYPMLADRVVVAHNGVDALRFSPAGRAAHREPLRTALGVGAQDLLLLFVGRGFARKGLPALLAALARCTDVPRMVLAVVGREAPRRWRAMAARLGVADRVRFVGHAAEPERYYAAADVFVLPTLFDPFANATLEAMAVGLPVVTTRRNGAAEILTPGADGLVLEHPTDAEALAEILRGLRDPARREALGARARQTALGHTWDGPLARTLTVYRQVLNDPKGFGR